MKQNITDADKSRFHFVALMQMKTDESNCLTTVVFSTCQGFQIGRTDKSRFLVHPTRTKNLIYSYGDSAVCPQKQRNGRFVYLCKIKNQRIVTYTRTWSWQITTLLHSSRDVRHRLSGRRAPESSCDWAVITECPVSNKWMRRGQFPYDFISVEYEKNDTPPKRRYSSTKYAGIESQMQCMQTYKRRLCRSNKNIFNCKSLFPVLFHLTAFNKHLHLK
jgi:hypothetical protein